MVEISLRAFIRTGEFGPVRLGMTREEVAAVLGPPDATSAPPRKRRPPSFYKYGDLEFHFDLNDGTLWLIHMDGIAQVRAPEGGERVKLDPWIIQAGLTTEALGAALTSVGVRYSIGPDRWNPGCVRVETESNVKFIFVDKPAEGGLPVGLDAVSISGPRRALPVKQVSVTLPEAMHEKVRQEALRRRTSISRLCRDWILDGTRTLPEDDG